MGLIVEPDLDGDVRERLSAEDPIARSLESSSDDVGVRGDPEGTWEGPRKLRRRRTDRRCRRPIVIGSKRWSSR